MPGPVSDSYDPEFGTRDNATVVSAAVQSVRDTLTEYIGSEELKDIVGVCSTLGSGAGTDKSFVLSEAELRILRFCVDRALESL